MVYIVHFVHKYHWYEKNNLKAITHHFDRQGPPSSNGPRTQPFAQKFHPAPTQGKYATARKRGIVDQAKHVTVCLRVDSAR